jgi:hypothetical protein
MKDMSVEALKRALEIKRQRIQSLSSTSKPTKDELRLLDQFGNTTFHTLRHWVPLVAIVDAESQRLTSRNDCAAASALICAQIEALMKIGLIGDEIVERSDGTPSTAKLWLTARGMTHFATGLPNLLRQPVAFARRHLSLFQLVAVIVTISVAILTFVARVLGWVG